MAIVSTDIKFYLSGGAGNTNPNASLGGVISTTEITDNTLHNLFDKVSAGEAQTGDTEYRAIFIKNTHASLTLAGAKVYIQTNTPSTDTSVQISVATEDGSPIQTIADESTAPTGQSFSTADGESNALSLGDLAAGAVKGLWIKRIVSSNASAYANDSVVIKVVGETEA